MQLPSPLSQQITSVFRVIHFLFGMQFLDLALSPKCNGWDDLIYDGVEIGFLLDFESEATCSSQIDSDGTLSLCQVMLSGCQSGREC